MVKIAFYNSTMCVRGTSVALFDYAKYSQEILKNESIIITPVARLSDCDLRGLTHFMQNFIVKTHTDLDDLDRILLEEKCDMLYVIKFGNNDGILSKKVKTVIHCVFDMSQPHGDVYAGVSHTLAAKFGKTLFVPHMVSIEPDFSDNWRRELNIPENAIVFGRSGGPDTWNLSFSWEVIFEVLAETQNIWFLFINTIIPCHPRIICLPKVTENKEKSKFIATCDAGMELGTMGHTFGLNLAEFSIHNKPLVIYKPEPVSFALEQCTSRYFRSQRGCTLL